MNIEYVSKKGFTEYVFKGSWRRRSDKECNRFNQIHSRPRYVDVVANNLTETVILAARRKALVIKKLLDIFYLIPTTRNTGLTLFLRVFDFYKEIDSVGYLSRFWRLLSDSHVKLVTFPFQSLLINTDDSESTLIQTIKCIKRPIYRKSVKGDD